MLLARRRVERLAADASLSDPTVARTTRSSPRRSRRWPTEEAGVSEARHDVIVVLDVLQDELKRRYKDDPSLSLR